MKKLLMAVAAFGMLLTSCAKDDTVAPVEDKEALVSFCVNSPAVATRYGEGETAQDLYYAVYDTQEGYVAGLSKVDGSVEIKTSTTVNLNLVQGRSYEVIFWAQAEGAPYTFAEGLKADEATMTINDVTALVANNEAYDAFYAHVESFEVKGAVSQTVELKRPFAQLNVATADTALASTAGVDIATTGVEVKGVYTTLNLADDTVDGETTLTFAPTTKANGKISANGKEYDHIAMNYLLVNDKKLVDVTLTLAENNNTAALTRKYTSVPVQRNYRTNIIGNILTSTADFNVEIKPGFIDTEVVTDQVTSAEELAKAFAAGLPNITLTADIELDKTLTVPAGKTVVLDLNEKTLSGDWAKAEGAVINVAEGATLTVSGGTISSTGINGGSAIVNNGVTTIEDVTINGAPIQDGGWPSYGINNYGTLTVNGADITTYHGAIATGADGVTVINDATVDVGNSTETNQTSWALYVYDNGQLTVNGGSFSNTKDEKGEVYGGGYICTSSTKETVINGGTFDKTEGDNNGTGFYYNNKNLVVKGGTFDANPSAYVADGYTAVDNGNGTWTVMDEDSKVSSVEALQSALSAGGVVYLDADMTLTESLTIPEGVEVTLNLNGKNITGNNTQADGPVVKNEGTLTIIGGTISSTAENGPSAVYNYGTLTLENATIVGAQNGASGNASYAVNTTGAGSKLTVKNSSISGRGAVGATNGTKVEINGGTYHTPEANWGHAVYASGEGTEVVINGGTFTEGYVYANDLWGMYQIYSGNKAKVIVNNGDFSQEWDCANGYDLATANEGKIEIKGGVFADNPSSQNGKSYVAAGYITIQQTDGTYLIAPIIKEGVSEIELGDAHPYATIVVDGDITIKGDTQVKTITSTTGGTITIEEGKTLTLNNFSFGSGSNPGQTYKIEGGKVEANYGFFQHGTYELHSDFETGYMYYSFGSNITVYGTFHSQGKGDGLDYVRGNLTIAAGGKSIHDKTLWVGQPESWGAMSASLTIEPGGYVQANTLKVYTGSSLTYTNDADLSYNNTDINQGGTITKL